MIPEPLRAAEDPSFTNYSVVVRLPDIARRTLAENPFPAGAVAQIEALITEIPHGKVRSLALFPVSGDSGCSEEVLDAWEAWVRPYLGMNWLEIPWFFAEEYFYIRMLEASGYFSAGDWHKRDPYARQKRLGLQSTRASLNPLAEDIQAALERPAETYRDTLARLLLVDLWGNQNDLSMWPVQHNGGATTGGSAGGGSSAGDGKSATSGNAASADADSHTLVNDLPALLAYLDTLAPADTRVDLLLDNAGYELVADLALADFLLHARQAAQVTLHAKCYPVFVSDALGKDIHDTLDYLVFEGHPATQAMGVRLRMALIDGRLRLRHHPFWTSPLAAWEMPADLQAEMAASNLLIAKGDANYRRLLGDRHWPTDIAFASLVDYLPCGVLALRTLKSEIAVGIDPARIPTSDPEWMINGRWGLVQFAPPKK
jgi:hypothetical protein